MSRSDPFFASIMAGQRELLSRGLYSDIVVKLDEYQWNLHRSIITAQSKFFNRMCDSPFKEAQDGVVILHDDEPSLFARLITYMYTGEYPNRLSDIKALELREYFSRIHDIVHDGKDGISMLELHVQMHGLANKYLVDTLKPICFRRFEEIAQGEFYPGSPLLGPNAESIQIVNLVFENTIERDRDFRELAIHFALELATGDGMLGNEEWKKVIMSNPEIAWEMITRRPWRLVKHTREAPPMIDPDPS
ncbi:MAG: hypothetical protein Q9227_002073 [Pyrenula ochraceoflavens]